MKIFVILLIFVVKDVENVDPKPPEPLQYQTSIVLNGIKGMYYSDRTLFKERLDLINQNYYTIIDFEHYREYILYKDECQWSQIPGKISPMLFFSVYEFIGNTTFNGTLAYQWNGCHYFEIPPAPYKYYVGIKDNIPLELDLPTIDRNLTYFNFKSIRPSSDLFTIPINCTQQNFNPMSLFDFYSKNDHLNNLC